MKKLKDFFLKYIIDISIAAVIVAIIIVLLQKSNYTICRDVGCNLEEEYFTKIIDDNLYILFRSDENGNMYDSVDDISNYDILTLVFNNYSNVYEGNVNYSKKDVDLVFERSPFVNLIDLKYEDFDNYIYDNKTEYFINDGKIKSVRNQKYAVPLIGKIIKFERRKYTYYIDAKYLFANNSYVMDKGANGYGSINDLSDINKKIVVIDNKFNANEYFYSSFDKVKDKLDTYHYVFESDKEGRVLLKEFRIS